jgi:hypothetical protein
MLSLPRRSVRLPLRWAVADGPPPNEASSNAAQAGLLPTGILDGGFGGMLEGSTLSNDTTSTCKLRDYGNGKCCTVDEASGIRHYSSIVREMFLFN